MNETATAPPQRNTGIVTAKSARKRRQPEKKQEQIASQRCGGIPTAPYFNSIAKPASNIQQLDRESELEKSLEQIQDSQPPSPTQQTIEGDDIKPFPGEPRQHDEKKIQKTELCQKEREKNRQKEQQQHFEKRIIHDQTDKQKHQMNHIEQYKQLHSQKMEQIQLLVRNLQNQINILHSDMRHLEKRCKFYERKSAGHEKRQRKIERILATQRKKKEEKLVPGTEWVNDDDEEEDEQNEHILYDTYDDIDDDVYKDAANSDFWIDDCNENENKQETDANDERDNGTIRQSASGFKRERTSKTESQKKRVRKSQTSKNPNMNDDKQVSIVPHNALDFNIMFRRLQAFHHEYGTCNVPKGYDDSQLRRWTSTWRATKSHRYNRVLETAGGPEVVFAGLEDGVIASIARFRADGSKNNASQGGSANKYDGLELSEIGLPLYSQAWEEELVKHIESRAEERRCHFLLQTRYQMECLDTLDFEWCLSKAVPFEERLEQIANFIAENGHCDVHRSHEELGEFFHRMRRIGRVFS